MRHAKIHMLQSVRLRPLVVALALLGGAILSGCGTPEEAMGEQSVDVLSGTSQSAGTLAKQQTTPVQGSLQDSPSTGKLSNPDTPAVHESIVPQAATSASAKCNYDCLDYCLNHHSWRFCKRICDCD